jgi:hypothetical protein
MSRAYKNRRKGSSHPNRESLMTPRSKAHKAGVAARRKNREAKEKKP